jgi:hypothetical protein
MLKYENPEILLLSGSYETNDARIILYSPSLSFNYNADMLRFTGYWKNKSGLKFSGYFTYMNITDGNAANQFQFRVGKEFYKSIMIGYEYEYQNFAIDKSKALLTDRYYSPQDYQSHCLWIDWTAIEEQPVKLVAGGRLGYIPASDFVIREVYADAVYNPVAAFLIKGRVTVGSTYRFDSSYNSVSAYISAYWSF